MNDSITIKQVVELLRADGTLKGYFGPDECMEQTFTHLSYSSADVQPNTFFICKGLSFKEEYLLDAAAKGAGAYLSEQQYETALPCVLVSDIRRAMSLVSIAFYHKAYESFRLIGLTGTKGKTTTTYFMKIFWMPSAANIPSCVVRPRARCCPRWRWIPAWSTTRRI